MLLTGFPCLISCCTAAPAEARTIMAGIGADLVFCGLTGADLNMLEFLEHVQRVNPHCIRLVYGAEPIPAELLKLVQSGFAHRFFTYTGGERQAREVVARALALHGRLAPHGCLHFLERTGNIAGLPMVIRELEEVLVAPGGRPEQLVAVLEKEELLASRLLQLVNSAVFFKSAAIDSLREAIVFLGTGRLREIVLFLAALEIFPQPESCRYQAIRVTMHSLQCARLACCIAGQLVPGREEEVGTAALLHDLGKLAYYSYECSRYLEAVSGSGRQAASTVLAVEEQVFGLSHGRLGGALLLWWNMPLATVETAVSHHLPLADLQGIPKCVAIADRFLQAAASQWRVMGDLQELPQEYPFATWRKIAAKLVNTLA
jgi:HD-like signal output (HDOD) protein